MKGLTCTYCEKENCQIKLELTESMLLLCPRCSRLFVSKEYEKPKLYFGPAL